jgi:hypothetical protein
MPKKEEMRQKGLDFKYPNENLNNIHTTGN